MRSEKPEALGSRAESEVARIFEGEGWRVDREPAAGRLRADLLLRKGGLAYVAEVKAVSEGRPDRVIAVLSQALLQSRAYARAVASVQPLAIAWVRAASPALIQKVNDFFREFAPDAAIGVVSGNGARHFIGHGLERLNESPSPLRKDPLGRRRQAYNLFSDLNQWMLKVLLAPELPEHLLVAPRAEYRNVSQLARAADVSMMSAFRFVENLRAEGFLDESDPCLRLVRRVELFRRWQSSALRSSPELRMCFLMPGSAGEQLPRLLSRHGACLGLFAAADALGLGHVSGVPPCVYVPRLNREELQDWREVIPASPGEQPHFILKQALAPQSLFRAAVLRDGFRVADVLQVWLDVSASPARGSEQGELIYKKLLQRMVEGAA
jgi:hypothetical protein